MKLAKFVGEIVLDCTVFALVLGVILLLVGLVGCGTNTVTGPSPDTRPVAQSTPVPAPVPTPKPTPTPAPEKDKGPVSVVCGTGDVCTFSNTADSVRGVLAFCTYPLQRNDWGSLGIDVPPGQNTIAVTPYEICDAKKIGVPEVRCSTVSKDVQLDFEFRSTHIGHFMPKLTYPANPEKAWKETDSIVTESTEYGEWGECSLPQTNASTVQQCTEDLAGIQTRTVTKVVVTQKREINTCSQEIRNVGDPVTVRTPLTPETKECTLTVSVPCPPPPPPPPPVEGSCYYNVPGSHGKDKCIAQPGYVSWNAKNHLCELTFPGISDRDFELNPGQSADGCLDKHSH